MSLFSKSKKNAGYLAICFQQDGLCAAQVKRSTGAKPEVMQFACFSGKPLTGDSSLEKLGKDLRAGHYQCGTMLSANEYQILSVEAPNVPPDELKTAIRWRLKDLIDYHINDATIDVVDVPPDKNAPTRNHSMLAVAARNQLIEQRQAMFAKAKIPLNVIDIPEMAQRNISTLLGSADRGLALLTFAEGGGLLTITYSGELYLSRHIDIPLEQLQQSDADLRQACFDRITLELQRSLDHFDRQYHFITMSKLVLGPIAGAGEALREYLASNLYLPVESMVLEEIFDIEKTPDLQSIDVQQKYLLVLGAALREEERLL